MSADKPTIEELQFRIKQLENENSVLKLSKPENSQAKELYLKIFEDFPALIWRSGLDKLCNYFNKTWLDFTGRTLEQECGNGWTEGVHPDDFDYCLKIYVDAFDKRDPFVMDYRLKNKFGEYRWIRDYGRPFFDLDNTFLGYIGSCYDISENKEKEQLLIEAKDKAEENEEKFKTIFNMSQSLVCIADINTSTFKFINPSFEKILGYSEQELLNKSFLEFIHPDDVKPTIAVIEEKLHSGIVVQTFENRYLCKNGNYCWLSWNSFPLPEKGITYAIAHDVTELKENEKELQNKNEEYEAINEELTQSNEELLNAKVKAEENEIQLNAILENSPTGFAIYKISTGEVTYVNNAFANAYHIPIALCSNVSAFFAFVYGDQMEIGNKILNDVKSGIPEKMKWDKIPIIDKVTKNTHYVSASNIIIEELDLMISTVMDITSQVENENELKLSKEKSEESRAKFKLLNLLTSEMLLLNNLESIYNFITEKLHKHYVNTIVLYVSIDELSKQTRLEGISGLDNSLFKKVIKISRINPIGKEFQLSDLHNKYFKSGNLVEFNGGLAEFSASEFPALAANAIEKLIGLHKIYTIGINKDDELLGAIHFLTFNKQVITDNSFIEVFVKQAGLVLQKKNTEKALIIAKEKAEESEIQMKKAQHTALVGNWIWYIQENRLWWSDEMYRIFDIDKNTFKGKLDEVIENVIHPEDREAVDNSNRHVINHNKPIPVEYRIIRNDGSVKYIFGVADNLVLDDKGKSKILTGIVKDITEYKLIQNDLVFAKEKAEESDRLKTEFINNMSHEIRTPMNGILGFSKLLIKPENSPEKQKNYIDIIHNSSNQLLRIIDDILEISRLGTKQVTAIEKEFCLNDMLLKLFSIFDIKAKENNTPLYFKKGLSDQASIILSDEKKLYKILSNLLENALKFTSNGFVELGYQLLDRELEIFVKDTGAGIKEENKVIIFDRFSQEEKELSRNVGGLGLGLSIAKENAELLGGQITVKSEKGKGSTFFVTIPYRPVSSETENADTGNYNNEKEEEQEKWTILIAEDEEINYLYIETLLEDELQIPCIILHAKNGQEAVEICKGNNEVDIILMDLKMPILNGFDATSAIKNIRPDLPIVAQTAYTTDEYKEKAYTVGCNDFISKPISEENLNQILNKYLKHLACE